MKASLALGVFLAAMASLSCARSASAGTREDVLAGTARCGAISDDRIWLDCYYGAAQPMRNRYGLTPAPEFQTKLVPVPGAGAPALAPSPQIAATAPPMPQQGKGGGLMGALFGGKVLINRMPLTAYSFDKNGIVTVTLSDGEVWRQLADDDSLAKWRGPAARYVVTIKEGSLGSANLELQGDSVRYKVRRIR